MKHLSTNLLGLLALSLTFTVSTGWADCKTEGFRRTHFILSASEADENHQEINQNHRAFCKALRDRLHQSCDTKTTAEECKCVNSPDFINGCREALTERGLEEGECARLALDPQEKLARLKLIIEEADQVLKKDPARVTEKDRKQAEHAKQLAIEQAGLLIEEMNKQKEALAQEQKKLAIEKAQLDQVKMDLDRLEQLKKEVAHAFLKQNPSREDNQQISESLREAVEIKKRKDARKRADGIPALPVSEEGERLLKELRITLIEQDLNTEQRINLSKQVQEGSVKRTEKLQELRTLEESYATLLGRFKEYSAKAIKERKNQKKQAREKETRASKEQETLNTLTPASVAAPTDNSTEVTPPTERGSVQTVTPDTSMERDETLEILQALATKLGLPPPDLNPDKIRPVVTSDGSKKQEPTPSRGTRIFGYKRRALNATDQAKLRVQQEELKNQTDAQAKSQPAPPTPEKQSTAQVQKPKDTPVSQLVSGPYHPKPRIPNARLEYYEMNKLLKGKPPGTYIRLRDELDPKEEDLYFVRDDKTVSHLGSIKEGKYSLPKIKTWKNFYSK